MIIHARNAPELIGLVIRLVREGVGFEAVNMGWGHYKIVLTGELDETKVLYRDRYDKMVFKEPVDREDQK